MVGADDDRLRGPLLNAMRSRTRGSFAALLAAGALLLPAVQASAPRHVAPPLPPPAGKDAPGLPPLPARLAAQRELHDRGAARSGASHHRRASLVLDWRNTTGAQALRASRSTSTGTRSATTSRRRRAARARRAPDDAKRDDRGFGYTEVTCIRLLGERRRGPAPDAALRAARRRQRRRPHRHGGAQRPRPIAPGASGALPDRLDVARAATATWAAPAGSTTTTSSPSGSRRSASSGRAPWNAHPVPPLHRVLLRLRRLRRAAHRARGLRRGRDGPCRSRRPTTPTARATFRFRQEDVHDFAWTASRRFLERRARFEEPGYPPVDIRLLAAARARAPRPSATSRPRRSRCAATAPGRRPIPTRRSPWSTRPGAPPRAGWSTRRSSPAAPPSLARARCRAPRASPSTSAGHQFWYGLVGTNEFEEAWLDEGFNSYHDDEGVAPARSGPRAGAAATSGFGQRPRRPHRLAVRGARRADRAAASESLPRTAPGRRGGRDGAPGVGLPRRGRPTRSTPTASPRSACRRSRGCVGDETMTRILRTYARRYRFAHPTTEDFIAIVERGDGQGLALVLRPDVVLRRAVRLRGRGQERAGAQSAGYFGRAGRRARAAARPEGPEERQGRSGRTTPRSTRDGRRGRGAAAGRAARRVRGRPRGEARRGTAQYRWTRFRYRGAKVRARGRRPGRQDRDRRRPREQLLAGRRRARRIARRRSGPRAGCSGSRTCWSCTRSWADAMIRDAARRAAAALGRTGASSSSSSP